ncbi:MAG: hypothetical protein ABI548_05445 [Polyangiaceae bacterium]
MSASHDPTDSFRKADRVRGLLIVGLTFALCLVISVWVRRLATPVFTTAPAAPSKEGVVGFPNHVDVVRTLPRARRVTPRDQLRGIVAEDVSSDGTVDLTDDTSRVRYSFASAQGEGPQPVRAPGTLARRPSCGRQSVAVRTEGLVAEKDAAEAVCNRHPTDPLPDPGCSMTEVWAHALGQGVPKDQRARIEYYRANAGPAWRFETQRPLVRFFLSADCKRELEGRDSLSIGN